MNLRNLCEIQKKLNASDFILKVGSPPLVRVLGELVPLKMPSITRQDLDNVLKQILSESKYKEFYDRLELDCSLSISGIGRYRVNVFQQRGSPASVFHYIPQVIPEVEELGLPAILKDLSMRPRGLLIVTGPSGSGKTTTQAALIDYRNRNDTCHIVTVEDPIEYIHESKKALINQREVGRDTNSFADALKYVLRQDPDVILVGEMRDLETISLAITAAETGHLVFSTLHTVSAGHTINRILGMYSTEEERQVRFRLADSLRWIVGQRLLPRIEGGRVAVFEIMQNNIRVKDLVINGESEGKTFYEVIENGQAYKMQTFDQHIVRLFMAGIIDEETSLTYASSRAVVRQGIDQVKSGRGEKTSDIDGLKIDIDYDRKQAVKVY